MVNIELTENKANTLIASLEGLTDRLELQLKEEHSGIAQFLIESSLNEVKSIAADIEEQVKAQTPVVVQEPEYKMTAQA